MVEIEDVGRIVVDVTGRPVVVFVPTAVYSDRPHAVYPQYNKEHLAVAVEARLNWCVAVELSGLARGWAALFVLALGRRYKGVTYDDFRALEKSGSADLWGASRPGIDPSQVLSLRYCSASGHLTTARAFEEGGVVHPRGANLAFSPSEQTLGVVEYPSKDALFAKLLAEAYDLPAAEARVLK